MMCIIQNDYIITIGLCRPAGAVKACPPRHIAQCILTPPKKIFCRPNSFYNFYLWLFVEILCLSTVNGLELVGPYGISGSFNVKKWQSFHHEFRERRNTSSKKRTVPSKIKREFIVERPTERTEYRTWTANIQL